MIGDPRPTTERKLITIEEVLNNGRKIRVQLDRFLDDSGPNALISLNNHDWLSKIDILSFLRDYGKHFNINYMIAKDTIASRLDSGISFTEFTYTILQAIDFLYLYQNHGCELQIGGSDQWGNLTSGTELIRKSVENAKVFGVTSPLITNSDGTKFGKSEGRNIWLDAERTSPYHFYQYWMNVADADIIDFMKRLSMKAPEEIMAFTETVETQPHLRLAQKALAEELTLLVHGTEGLESAKRITEVFFSGHWDALSEAEMALALSDAPTMELSEDALLIDVLAQGKVVVSKREARDLINAGSISVNSKKASGLETMITQGEAYFNRYTVIRKGKKTYFVVKHR